jgi:futalosine hydrolase
MIALLCSVQAEAEDILARTKVTATTQLGSKAIIAGTFAGREVLLCVGGMGKVNAAHAATLMIAEFAPEALVLFGIGGAYPSSGAAIGDVALAHQEIAGDEGVLTHDGFMDTEHIGIPLIKTASSVIYTTYPASEPLLKRSLRRLITTAESGSGKVHFGPFVTLSTCTGTSARARELEERYHGLCENMEGAAVAQVATLHGVPWLEVRGISNIVEDRDLSKWDIPRAAGSAQRAVVSILEAWGG